MRKSAVVVIHMLQIFNEIELLFPKTVAWEQWKENKPNIPFADDVIMYLNALSKSLLQDRESRIYPDVVTFAFFCRKSNLLTQKSNYTFNEMRLGRGIAFHIAPSNVPINFAYSWIAGLLSGNTNVVRVSSKYFPQVDLVIKHIQKISEQERFKDLSQKTVFVRYNRMSNATGFFSSFCNTRIIWGGDQTIAQIRKSPILPRAFDITFADRYSLAVINADKLVLEQDMEKLIQGFYNDTYLFDQNACTAPHLVVWLGKKTNIKKAKTIFWEALQKEVDKKYEFQSIMAIDKLTAFYRQAIEMPLKKETYIDNKLIRVQLDSLSKEIDDYRCTGGYFSEYDAGSLDEIAGIVKNNYQTLAYYGVSKEKLERFVHANTVTGIDRIVPIGTTTDFALTWDGIDLINTLSRTCTVL